MTRSDPPNTIEGIANKILAGADLGAAYMSGDNSGMKVEGALCLAGVAQLVPWRQRRHGRPVFDSRLVGS